MRGGPNMRTVGVAALVAFAVAVGAVTLLDGYSAAPLLDAIQFLAVISLGAVVIGGAVALALVQLADWRAPEEDFERIVQRAERLGSDGAWCEDDDEAELAYPAALDEWTDGEDHIDLSDAEAFRTVVREAARELPLELCARLEHVAIVVTDAGSIVRVGRARRGPYGCFQGDAISDDYFHDRVLIFRDRLLRDFGDDPELLREQIRRTLTQELTLTAGSGSRGAHRR